MKTRITKLSTTTAAVVVGALALGTGGVALSAENSVVLWNKLGSAVEVTNSETGANFGTRPGVVFVDGLYGGAVATTGGENGGGGYLTMDPDDFFGADRTRGTVEAWIQKRMQEFIPFQTPLLGIFGIQPYDGGGDNSFRSISAYWSDAFTGGGGLQFDIHDVTLQNGRAVIHSANDLGWDDVPIHTWVHVAFVWDLEGINGGDDTMRIYRDGEIVATNTDDIAGIYPGTQLVKILGHHAYSRFGEPTAYMDNLIVWNHAKTDFSHRFTEEPGSGAVAGEVGGSVTGFFPETVDCLNETTGQNVEIVLGAGEMSWNCEEEGLLVEPGDRIVMTVEGSMGREFDFNGDGCIDVDDVQMVIDETRQPEPRDMAYDVNGDGVVNIADARALVLICDNPRAAPCN